MPGKSLPATILSFAQPHVAPSPTCGRLTHPLQQVPFLLQEGSVVTCRDKHGPPHAPTQACLSFLHWLRPIHRAPWMGASLRGCLQGDGP